MPLIRRLLLQAAQRLAADPRVRAKASEVIEQEVKPRAEAAWRDTKPKLAAVKEELQDIAAEADPVTQPREFAAKLKARFLDIQSRR